MTTLQDGGERPVAVVAVTRRGARLAAAIRAALGEAAEVHVVARHAEEAGPGVAPIAGPVRERVAALFPRVGALVLIVAVGAAVRLIAPHLRDKRTDPAVLAVDERGLHVVPLVGGHVGGANRLAERIGAALGARPVVTTASDELGLPPLDLLGREAGWKLEASPEALTRASAAAVDGRPVAICIATGERPSGEPDRLPYPPMPGGPIAPQAWNDAGAAHVRPGRARGDDPSPIGGGEDAFSDVLDALPEAWPRLASEAELAAWDGPAIVVSDRADAGRARSGGPTLVYRPPTLVLGVGCSLGASADELEGLAVAALAEAGLARGSVARVATIDRRLEEPGVVELARRLGVPLVGYGAAELAAVAGLPTPSDEVARHVGTPGVAEPAALLASGGGALLVPKRKSAMGTVAVARVGAARGSRGSLALVGLGPGPLDLLTPRALRALVEAEVVVGYRAYLDSLAGLVPPSRTRAYELGEERERAGAAIELARAGRRVALVSSGDIGVYGMAGLVYELLHEHDGRGDASAMPSVEVIPGVTAAGAAAALLGAPLMLDFAAISLSDLLVPWGSIEKRIEAVARGDLVVALYNPASARRRRQLTRAKEILLAHRPADTPVGFVREAYRPEQSVRLGTLADLDDPAVDMKTIVIVGNSRTARLGDRLVTRRGYTDPPGGSDGADGAAPPATARAARGADPAGPRP